MSQHTVCTDPFLCRGSSESCVVDISFHLIKIRLKLLKSLIAAASAAVGRSRAGRGHAPRAGIVACGYRYRNARLQLPTPLAVDPSVTLTADAWRYLRNPVIGFEFARFRVSSFGFLRVRAPPTTVAPRAPRGPGPRGPRVPRADGVQSGRGGKSVTARHARYTQTHVHRDRHRQVTRRP